jgi:hypothetical protein
VSDLRALLQEFYREKLEELLRHQAAARLIGQYDVNNTYQYIIAREDVQLSWVAAALVDLGGTVDTSATEPERGQSMRGNRRSEAARAAIEQDAGSAQAFLDRWRPRVEAMTNARHRGMLRVILGETLEHKRFFEQALAGRTDLLGRRSEQVGPRVGEVLPTRWVE